LWRFRYILKIIFVSLFINLIIMKIETIKTLEEFYTIFSSEKIKYLNKCSDVLETHLSHSFRVYNRVGNTIVFYQILK
jgi:uncharacterized membrane protein